MPDHPYNCTPEHCYWRGSISGVPAAEVDPMVRAPFHVLRAGRIAAAGRCFVQQIDRHIHNAGLDYSVNEKDNPAGGNACALGA